MTDILDLSQRLRAEGSDLSIEAANAIAKLGELLKQTSTEVGTQRDRADNAEADARLTKDLLGRYAAHLEEQAGDAYISSNYVDDDSHITAEDAETIEKAGEKFGVTTAPVPWI
jgi:hypothetical protein